jgi:hypothetical protein
VEVAVFTARRAWAICMKEAVAPLARDAARKASADRTFFRLGVDVRKARSPSRKPLGAPAPRGTGSRCLHGPRSGDVERESTLAPATSLRQDDDSYPDPPAPSWSGSGGDRTSRSSPGRLQRERGPQLRSPRRPVEPVRGTLRRRPGPSVPPIGVEEVVVREVAADDHRVHGLPCCSSKSRAPPPGSTIRNVSVPARPRPSSASCRVSNVITPSSKPVGLAWVPCVAPPCVSDHLRSSSRCPG